ncbi:MAG: hypothetical protein QNK04_08415 [Myxococcota bacterium]|nr:hypothetical protein [Myxococcota bacterium]
MDVATDQVEEIHLGPEPPVAEVSWHPPPPPPESQVGSHARWGASAPDDRESPELQLAKLARASGELRRVQAAVAARLIGARLGALFRALRETVRKHHRLEESEAFAAILGEALLSWTRRDPSARRPDPVIERDGYLCANPGCTSQRNPHDHHVIYRSCGGGDEEVNRLTLCAYHHQRCVHGEVLRVRGRAPDALVFEVGLRPGAPPLARYRSGDIELAAG